MRQGLRLASTKVRMSFALTGEWTAPGGLRWIAQLAIHSFACGREPSLEHSIGSTDSRERRIHELKFGSRIHQQAQSAFGARDHSAPQRSTEIQRRRDLRARRSQRRSRKSGPKNAPHAIADFWQPER